MFTILATILAIITISAVYYKYFSKHEGLDNTEFLNTRKNAIMSSKTDSIIVGRAERVNFTNKDGINTTRITVQSNLFNLQDPSTEKYNVIMYNGKKAKVLGNLEKGFGGFWGLIVSEHLGSTKLNEFCQIAITHSINGVDTELMRGDFM